MYRKAEANLYTLHVKKSVKKGSPSNSCYVTCSPSVAILQNIIFEEKAITKAMATLA